MTKPASVSIGTIITSLMSAMGLLLICISVLFVLNSATRHSDAIRTAIRTRISEHLFKTIIPLRNERGAENTSLAAEAAADDASVSDIRDYRTESEFHYNESVRLLLRLDEPDLIPLLRRLTETHDSMAIIRPRADAAIAQPMLLRDPVLVRNFMSDTQPLLDAIVATTDYIDGSMKLRDPVVDEYLSIKRAAWTARLFLGQMVARTQPAVSAGRALSPAEVLIWSQDEARAKLAWSLVLEAAARPDMPRAIVDAVAAANATFAGPEADARSAVLLSLADGHAVTTPVVELRRKDTDNNGLIVTVANTALEQMVKRADREAAAATVLLVLAILVLLAALALALAGAVIVQRKVIGPIRAMTRAMRRLAYGDTGVRIPGGSRHDEIGAMAAAVRVFRDSMITTGRLAAEQEADRVLLAERAAELERVVEALGLQNVRFSAALDNMSQALCMFDAAGRLIVANNRLADICGMDPAIIQPGATADAILSQAAVKSSLHRSDIEQMRLSIQELAAAGQPASRVRELVDGRTLSVSFVPVSGDGYLLTLEDITERMQIEARITHMAHHDALTGLPNRTRFHERLSEAVASSRRGDASAVLFLDLDHFKAVNDTLGHPIGDALLRVVASRLRAETRETDMVARLGGDEFAIVQASIDQPKDAKALAERLIVALCEPYHLDGQHVTIGTSIGIAILPGDGQDPDELLKNADMALYGAKADGRGRFRFFEPKMHALMQARRRLEVDLREALATGAFEVFYQPVMSIRTGTVTGFEALLRWNHAERGLVAPAEFVALAEEIGLIVPLGRWVLKQACADAASWPETVKVAVNVSAVQFGSGSLVADVATALTASGLDPARLELEITETVMLADTEAVLVVLHRLRELGVGIAMDDFGTGYSSLSYLRRFPFSKVKIDRSFIEDLETGTGCNAIVTAIIDLCDTLGMTTVVEGVETEDQLRLLRTGHCGEVQGHLFSPPRPASEVAALIRRLGQRELVADPA